MHQVNRAKTTTFLSIWLTLYEANVTAAGTYVLFPYWKVGPESWIGLKISKSKHWLPFTVKATNLALNHKNITKMLVTNILKVLTMDIGDVILENNGCKENTEGKRIVFARLCKTASLNIGNYHPIYTVRNVYRLKLHKYLRLNITFLEVKLSSAVQCLSGDLKRAYEYIKLNTQTTFNHLFYYEIIKLKSNNYMCGHFPMHIRFLMQSNISITLQTSPNLGSKFNIFFQVMDFRLITRYNMSLFPGIRAEDTSFRTPILSAVLYFLYTKRIHFRAYHLMTTRFYTLMITVSNSNNFSIFDGPSLHSDIIKMRQHGQKQHIKTSSFQAVILHVFRWPAKFKDIFKRISYKALTLPQSDIAIKENNIITKIKFPNPRCIRGSVHFCVLRIPRFEHQEAINITVTELKYSGPSTLGDQCLYGGMAIHFLNSKHDVREMLLDCSNEQLRIHSKTLLPTIISNVDTREIWISSVSYEGSGQFHAEILLSVSACNSILLSFPQKVCPMHKISRTRAEYTVYITAKKDFFNIILNPGKWYRLTKTSR